MTRFSTSGNPANASVPIWRPAPNRGTTWPPRPSAFFCSRPAVSMWRGWAWYTAFLRGTLDKVGVQADIEHIGQYKTAPNQFTERGFTPAHREMTESLNRDMYEQLVRGIAEGRKKRVEDVEAFIDEGPFLAEQAMKAGKNHSPGLHCLLRQKWALRR